MIPPPTIVTSALVNVIAAPDNDTLSGSQAASLTIRLAGRAGSHYGRGPAARRSNRVTFQQPPGPGRARTLPLAGLPGPDTCCRGSRPVPHESRFSNRAARDHAPLPHIHRTPG